VYLLRNMRTPILAVVLGLSLAGCLTIGDSNSSGGGDDGTGGGGGGGGGGGSGSGSGSGSNQAPSLDVTVDRTSVATELGKSEIVTLNFHSIGGYSGNVTVATSLLDAANAPLAGGITVTGDAAVTVTANATVPVMYTLKVPSNATGADLTGSLKFDVTSTAGTKSLTSTLAVAAVFTATYAAGLADNQAAHPDRGLNIGVKKGAKIHFTNSDTAIHITHGDGAFPHETQGATGGLPAKTYEVLTAGLNVGANGSLGCHSHGTATYAKFTVE